MAFGSQAEAFEALEPKVMGRLQIAATTEDLKRGDGEAGTDDLFTGTTQDVVLEKLVIRLPNVDCSDDTGGFSGISIQTDDETPSVIIDATNGAKEKLTAEAQLAWTGVAILIKVGTKIQITIIGAAADDTTTCDVIAEYRAVASGGYLA